MSSDNLLSKSEEKQRGLRLREFEWYEVETKIRKFVFELLDPNMKKLIQDRQKVDGFEDLLNQITDKIKYFDDTLVSNERRMKLFDESTKKFTSTHQDIGKLKIDMKAKSDDISKNKNYNEDQFTQIQGQLTQLVMQIESISMNMEEQFKQMDKFKKETIQQVDNLSNKQIHFKEEVKEQMNEQFEHQKLMNDQINTLKTLLGQKEIHINQNTEAINQLQRRILQNDNEIFGQSKKLEELPFLQQRAVQMQKQIDMHQHDITTLSQYIDLNIPLNTYTQITECLYSCISNDAQKKLVDFDDKQFKVLNSRISKLEPGELVEDSTQPNKPFPKQTLPPAVEFSTLNTFFSDKMSNVVKRNKKYKKLRSNKERVMNHLKSDNKPQQNQTTENAQMNTLNEGRDYEKEVVMGQTFDALDNYNSNQQLQINVLNPYNHTQNSQPPSSNQISTQNSRRDQRGVQERFSKQGGNGGVSSQAEGYDEEILSVEEIIAKELSSPQFYQRLDRQIKEYASQFSVQQQQFQQEMKKQFDDREDHYLIQYDRCYEMIEQEQEKVNNMKSSLTKTIEAQNESLNTIQSCLQLIQQANLIFESNIFHLNQFCTILTHLTLQDEKDKNSIGLYGYRESPIDQNSGGIHTTAAQQDIKINQNTQRGLMNNIHLDEKCVSCSGQSIQLNSLFKLACLAYKPLPINLDGKQYSRIDLLQLCQKILNNITLPPQSKKQPKTIHKKILRSSIKLDEENDMNKNQQTNDALMQETSRSFHDTTTTHRVGTANTLNQTIDQGISLTHRPSLNQSNHNLENEITLLSNTFTAREQGNTTGNYYEIKETNPREKPGSRQLSTSTGEWSILQNDKLKRFPSVDSGQIQLSDHNISQVSTQRNSMQIKHKVRKLVSNKNEQTLNKTTITFQPNTNQPNNTKDKASYYEKRRQFIMKQNVSSSLNSSSIIS